MWPTCDCILILQSPTPFQQNAAYNIWHRFMNKNTFDYNTYYNILGILISKNKSDHPIHVHVISGTIKVEIFVGIKFGIFSLKDMFAGFYFSIFNCCPLLYRNQLGFYSSNFLITANVTQNHHFFSILESQQQL